jgi:hypothetical protein
MTGHLSAKPLVLVILTFLSLGLARACEVGLEALDRLTKGQSQPAAWAEETAITKLVEACAGPVK